MNPVINSFNNVLILWNSLTKEAYLKALPRLIRPPSRDSRFASSKIAFKFVGRTKKLKIVNLPGMKISNPRHVLVKVAYTPGYGLDLHDSEDGFPSGRFTSRHKFSGKVVDSRKVVTIRKKGDKIIPNTDGSGKKKKSIAFHVHEEKIPYVKCPEYHVQVLGKKISMKQAALCEPLSCLAHGLDLISPILIGQKILIIGAGIMGNLWASILHLQSHKNVSVSEPNSLRLKIVKKPSRGYRFQTSKPPAIYFDVIIENYGYPAATMNSVRKLGILGCDPPSAKLKISSFNILSRELEIIGMKINPFTFPRATRTARVIEDRHLRGDEPEMKTYKLNQYRNAIEDLKKGSISKAIFKF